MLLQDGATAFWPPLSSSAFEDAIHFSNANQISLLSFRILEIFLTQLIPRISHELHCIKCSNLQ